MTESQRYSHPRCYAAHRADCSSKLSSEHFLSRALLKSIEAAAGGVYVRGFPWQKAEVERIGIESLGSKVLCRHHSSQLSALDGEALRLVKLVERWAAEPDGLYIDTVQGPLIERYLLKVLCGMLASRSARMGGGGGVASDVPRPWGDMLWGDCVFPGEWGLKVNAAVGDKWAKDPAAYHLAPILDDGVPVGLHAVFRRLQLILIMTNPPPRLDAALGRGSTFRPQQFSMRHKRGSVTINLRW